MLSPDDIKDVAFCRLFMDPQQSALDPQQQARPEPNPLGSIKKKVNLFLHMFLVTNGPCKIVSVNYLQIHIGSRY